VREKLDEGIFTLTYVPSNENLADIMMKPLQRSAQGKYKKARIHKNGGLWRFINSNRGNAVSANRR